MEEVLADPVGNPSSLHAEGRAARQRIESARRDVATLLGVAESRVVFTGGGSEALESAIRGVLDRAPRRRRRVLVSDIEHSAVLEAAHAAEKRGFSVGRIECGADGRVPLREEAMQSGNDVALVAVQWANNETGVVQPVEEWAQACRRRGVPLLVDAVQAAGKLAVDGTRLELDLIAVSAHKLGGPQGVGALAVREGLNLAPLIHGGAQERRRRGGTEAVASIAGFGAAARAAATEQKRLSTHMLKLRARVETRLRDRFPGVTIHGEGAPRLSNTVNFALDGVPGETLVIALDVAGFALSTGSACAAGSVKPSHVLMAMGRSEVESRQAVRLSMGWNTEAADVDRFLEAMPPLVDQVARSQEARC